jgi:hypothetical protein
LSKIIEHLAAFACSLAAIQAAAAPCTGVDRALPPQRKAVYAKAVEAHLNRQLGPEVGQSISLEPSDVLQVFRVGTWHIVYVNTHVSDAAYLFYKAPPQHSGAYLTDWAGAAALDEGPAIRRWLEAVAPGIPAKLAKCFAWHVTQGRDM